jgi:hypothetical protein
VYRSDPNAPTAEMSGAEFDRLARPVYVGVGDGAVDFEAAFDLACYLMNWSPTDPVVQELARTAVEGTDQERLVEMSRRVLSERFDPGFDLEPGWLTTLEQALEAVRADMRATGVTGPIKLVIPQWSNLSHAYVDYRGGYGSTSGIAPVRGSDALSALVAVADEAQDSIMETLWEVWPVCPSHQIGTHAREHEGIAVWWCTGDGGHVAAAVGTWPNSEEHGG